MCVIIILITDLKVFWSDNGDKVCIACADNYFILKYDASVLDNHLASGAVVPADGFEEAFEVLHDIQETVKNGCWVGDCFIYCSTGNRLNYLIGGQVHTIAHFDKSMFLLGYLPRDSKVFVCDKDVNVYGYSLSLQLLEYQSAILRGDFAAAKVMLPKLSSEQRNRVARFLDGLDMKELALETATDPDHRFDLAIQLRKLDIARQLAQESESENKWAQLGEIAMAEWKMPLARDCMLKSKDWSGLLLMYISTGDVHGLEELAVSAQEQGLDNVVFMCYLLCGRTEECLHLLEQTDRIPEAALFSRTYLPSHLSRLTTLWRASLMKSGLKKNSEALADPVEYENLFPQLKQAIVQEIQMIALRKQRMSSSQYPQWKKNKENVDPSVDPTSLPSIGDLIMKAESAYKSQPDFTSPKNGNSVCVPKSPLNVTRLPIINVRTTLSPQSTSAGAMMAARPPSSPSRTGAQAFGAGSKSNSLSASRLDAADADGDNISDNMSHLSMDVNTTGTGSIKEDLGDLNDSVSELSFTSSDNVMRPNAAPSFTSSLPTSNFPVMNSHASPAATAPPLLSTQPASTTAKDSFDFDDLDAALNGQALPSNGVARQDTSLTGDEELDEILNM